MSAEPTDPFSDGLDGLIASSLRVIEIDPPDDGVERAFSDRGSHAYAALRIGDRRVRSEGSVDSALPRNNAEVVILSRGAQHWIWRFAPFRRARWILVETGGSARAAAGRLGMRKQVWRRRVALRGVRTLARGAGPARTFRVLEVVTKRPEHRIFVSPGEGIERFFDRLGEVGASYALLRWFDRLPEASPGQDIDILVADDDLELVRRVADERPGWIKIDVHAVSALPGATVAGTAHFPPDIAEGILERSELWKDRYRVVSPIDHLLGLAYHAVYHKGLRSGLPSRAEQASVQRGGEGSHDYAATLATLADEVGIQIATDLESLEALLASRGWRPSHDMLARMAVENPWLRERLPKLATELPDAPPGLAVFFVRKRAVELGQTDAVLQAIEAEGFHILEVESLSDAAAEAVRKTVRGGNWTRGPWASDGGPPALFVVAHDLIPIPPDETALRAHPALDNQRLLAKAAIRDRVNARIPPGEHANVLHSSDHAREARMYVERFLPARAPEILAAIRQNAQAFETRSPVLRDLTGSGRRAKVELVEFEGRSAVKKTYRPQALRYLEREVSFIRAFGGSRPEIPPLLEKGPNYLIVPYYEDALPPRSKEGPLLPLGVARQAADLLGFFYEHGYAHMDFAAQNLLWNPHDGLKLVDFEFVHAYDRRPASLEGSYDIVGPPAGFQGDLPLGRPHHYDHTLKPYFGLDPSDLRSERESRQQWLRLRYRIRHTWMRKTRGQFARVRRRARDALRRGRRSARRNRVLGPLARFLLD